MNLIKETDIDDFIRWAEKNKDENIYPRISKEEVSYYVNRETEETYMMEYTFKTMEELKKYLEKFSGVLPDSYMLKKLTIQICQNRYMGELRMNSGSYVRKSNDEDKAEKTLPEYVYTL